MVIKALLFDLIDTLIEMPRRPREVLEHFLGDRSASELEFRAQVLCLEFPGMSCDEFFERLLDDLKIPKESAKGTMVAPLWRRSVGKAHVIDGARTALNNLRSTGYRLALVSNTTPPTRKLLEQLGLELYFDTITLSCDVGSLKPSRRIFDKTLDSLGVEADDACMIGDKWETDIVGARGAGMRAILVDRRLERPTSTSQRDVTARIPSISWLPEVIGSIETQEMAFLMTQTQNTSTRLEDTKF